MEPNQDQIQPQANLYPPPFSMFPGQPLMGPKYDEDYMRHLAELNDKLIKLKDEIEKMPKNDLEQFKDQKLPLARIKKIMKSDEDVRMISAEAPILFAKACEMFIIEMTHKAYYYAKKNNRKTLQRNDIAAAITDTEIYDFLLDIMPREEIINNAKDKQLSAYQRQLLDDAMHIQQLQSLPFQGQGMPPSPMIGGGQGGLNQNQLPPSNPSFSSVNRNQLNQHEDESEDEQEVDNIEDQIQGSVKGKKNGTAKIKEESKDQQNQDANKRTNGQPVGKRI